MIYIDDVLGFSKDKREHYAHLYTFLKIFEKEGMVISLKKMQLLKEHIEFLGVEIGKGKIKLRNHILRKILEYPDKLENLKQLQGFSKLC